MQRSSYYYTSIIFQLFLTITLTAQSENPKLAEDEIKSDTVNFQNRTTFPARPAARLEQVAAGRTLADEVLKSGAAGNTVYNIRRIYSPDEKSLMGADLVSLNPGSEFYHINRIARTIQGYLMTAFEYREDDAQALARMILYYNAGQRGKLSELSERYSGAVSEQLNSEKIGIAASYREWPGKTQLLIPLVLSSVRPGGNDLKSEELANVEPPLPPEEKQKLADIQEERRQEDVDLLTDKKNELENRIKTSEQQKEQKEDQIQESSERLNDLKKDPEKNREAIKAETEKQDKLVEEKDQLERNEAAAQKEVAAVTEELNQKKSPRAQKPGAAPATAKPQSEQPSEREKLKEELAKELKEEREEKSSNVIADKILFLKVIKYLQGGHYNNELWAIDANSDDALLRSPFSSICGRKFITINDESVLVVGYKGNNHTGAETEDSHHLVLLDREKLVAKRMSEESIFWRSHLEYRDNSIYAIEFFNKKYYLARFDLDLKRTHRSSEAIFPDSDLSFVKNKIYLTGKSKENQSNVITVLNRADLTLIKTIRTGN